MTAATAAFVREGWHWLQHKEMVAIHVDTRALLVPSSLPAAQGEAEPA
jgi:hypothetical protein